MRLLLRILYSHIFSEWQTEPPILAFFDPSLQEFPFLFVVLGRQKYQQSSNGPKNIRGKYYYNFGETISHYLLKLILFVNSKTFETYYNLKLLIFNDFGTYP